MQGRFAGGYGRFHGDDGLDGQPIKARFIWKDITATSTRFEQAFSYTAGVLADRLGHHPDPVG